MQRSKLTAAQEQWLEEELAAWQAADILSGQQAQAIRERYESADEIHQRRRSVAVQALFSVAAFLFGLAVLLLIGFNWDQLSREIKLVVVLGVVTATHVVGFKLRSHGRTALSEVVAFLGCLFYGAGIWLVAQAFHLEAHYPDGVWWWAIGVLPFALCLNSLALHGLYVFLLGLWAGMEVLGFAHLSPFWFFRGWHFPNGCYTLPLLAAPGLMAAYHRKSALAISLYVPLFAWWVILQAAALRIEHRMVFWIGNVGGILILLAEAHRPRDPRGIPYRLWGVLMVCGTLLFLGSRFFWDGMRYWGRGWSNDWVWYPALAEIGASFVLLVLAAVLLFAMRGLGAFNLQGEAGESDSIRRRWFAMGLVGSLMLMSIWSLSFIDSDIGAMLPLVIANLATLGLAVYLIKVGEQEDRTRPFATGVLLILLWALVRYIDLFGAAGGMLGAATVFALCGGGLVVIGNFWSRKRKTDQRRTVLQIDESLTIPHWVQRALEWVSQRQTAILLWTAIGQVGLLGGMILIESLPLMIGERIVLRVNPIDPRDMFRGDYVILNYDLNRLPVDDPTLSDQYRADRTVYVALEKDPDGIHWVPKTTFASLVRPSEGKIIRGRLSGQPWQPTLFGIEAYYVQEGQGRVLENLRNSKRLNAEVALAPWGQAKLVRLFED